MRNTLIEFLDSIREYIRISGINIARDDRESSEFVDLFIQHTPKLFPTKRNPLPDGTLPLTEEELGEFERITGSHKTQIYYDGTHIHTKSYGLGWEYLTNIKAILWLADRFNLERHDATNI